MGLSAVNFLITVENNNKWSALQDDNARKLKQIELRNHDITILLGNQMLEQTITIHTFSKNSAHYLACRPKNSGRLSKQTVTRT